MQLRRRIELSKVRLCRIVSDLSSPVFCEQVFQVENTSLPKLGEEICMGGRVGKSRAYNTCSSAFLNFDKSDRSASFESHAISIFLSCFPFFYGKKDALSFFSILIFGKYLNTTPEVFFQTRSQDPKNGTRIQVIVFFIFVFEKKTANGHFGSSIFFPPKAHTPKPMFRCKNAVSFRFT